MEALTERPKADIAPRPIPGDRRPLADSKTQEAHNEKEKKQMLILHMTTTDPAGAGYNHVRALNQYTNHRAHIINTHPNVFGHPSDIGTVFDYYDELEEMLVRADVIHFHKINELFEITLPEESSRKRSWRIQDFLTVGGKKKKLVYHIHGHPYERAEFVENGKLYGKKNAVVLSSTPDLQKLYAPYCDVRFFPNCVPIWHPAYLPRETNKMIEDKSGKKRLVVGHTVSDRHLKNTNEIEQAVDYVARTQPLNYLRMEKMHHLQTLKMQRISHIIFDHMQGYYGIASLEGFSMGKPVVAGLNDHCIKSILDFFKIPYSLPWQIARNLPNLKDTIMDLTVNKDNREYIGKMSRKFMEEVWSDKAIATRLAAVYESL